MEVVDNISKGDRIEKERLWVNIVTKIISEVPIRRRHIDSCEFWSSECEIIVNNIR